MPPPKRDEDNPIGALRAHAPVSVVRAAKASLKEPSRPFTPADVGRRLFATEDYSNRPPSAVGVINSKHFYDAAPKLGLPKLETRPLAKLESSARSILYEVGTSSPSADSPTFGLYRDGSPRIRSASPRGRQPSPFRTPATAEVLDLSRSVEPSEETSESSAQLAAWKQDVEAALSQLLVASQDGKSSETDSIYCKSCDTLGALIDTARQQGGTKWLNSPFCDNPDGVGETVTVREAVSEHMFRLMDVANTHPELLLKACSVLLKIVKGPRSLSATAKHLYRLSKDTAYDALFRQERLFEPILYIMNHAVSSSSFVALQEVLVYLTGCLKNVSNDAANQRLLAKLGGIVVLSSLITQLSFQAEKNPEQLESFAQVAVQATGVLRNLAVSPAHAQLFLGAGSLTAMRLACRSMTNQGELVLNVGRILSKLSLSEECQRAMENDKEYAPQLVQVLSKYAAHRAIMLRVAFVLGNLTTHSDNYRYQVFNVPGAMAVVLAILKHYSSGAAETDAVIPGLLSDNSSPVVQPHKIERLSKSATVEECLVKILRLVANLAIHADVGPFLAAEQVVADSLVTLFDKYRFENSEELVLNCVCACTNLSYYQSEGNKLLALPPLVILQPITPLLTHCDNDEAVIEAARMYGNYSRSADIRLYMEEQRVVEALCLLLDHSNLEVLYSVCGTLINLTMDHDRIASLVKAGGVRRMVEVLERVVFSAQLTQLDGLVASVVCKALFNVCVDDADQHSNAVESSFTPEEVQVCMAVLEQAYNSPILELEGIADVVDRLWSQVQSLQVQDETSDSGDLEVLPEA